MAIFSMPVIVLEGETIRESMVPFFPFPNMNLLRPGDSDSTELRDKSINKTLIILVKL
jgi:hypothetical protein